MSTYPFKVIFMARIDVKNIYTLTVKIDNVISYSSLRILQLPYIRSNVSTRHCRTVLSFEISIVIVYEIFASVCISIIISNCYSTTTNVLPCYYTNEKKNNNCKYLATFYIQL